MKYLLIVCRCDPERSEDKFCNEEGMCQCKKEFTGQKCDKCAPGYYDFSSGCLGKYT